MGKNYWRTASIFLLIIILFLVIFNLVFGNSNNQIKDITALTGITNPVQLSEISNAINNSPKHYIPLCDSQNNCLIIGRFK
jgi:hypothetical protein